jgi:serine/threonine-protein kinase
LARDIGSLYRRASDGTGPEERLTTGETAQRANSISPDGAQLVFEELTPSAGYDLWMLSLSQPPQAEPLLASPFDERDAAISPDGRWMAYESNESGQEQIYVRPFPNVADALHQVSFTGGRTPVWAANGRELFFVTRTSVMSVPVQLTTSFKGGNPVRLFDGHRYLLDGRLTGGGTVRTFDVTRDGSRFLMIKNDGETTIGRSEASARIILVQNWQEELRAKLAATSRPAR